MSWPTPSDSSWSPCAAYSNLTRTTVSLDACDNERFTGMGGCCGFPAVVTADVVVAGAEEAGMEPSDNNDDDDPWLCGNGGKSISSAVLTMVSHAKNRKN